MFSLKKIDPFSFLTFLYFFTLHADHLNIVAGGYSLRLNNLIALVLSIIFLCRLGYVAIDRKLGIALLLITLCIFISLLNSPFQKRCFFFLGWWIATAIFYFILPYLLLHVFGTKPLLKLYFGAALCVGIYALAQLMASLIGLHDPFASQIFWNRFVRPNAFAYEPSYYALFLTPFVMMANFHFLQSPQPMIKKWQLVGLNLLYLISTSTSALFGYLIFFLFLVCYVLLSKKYELFRPLFKFLSIFVGLFTTAALVFPKLMKDFFLKFFFSGFMTHHSFFERWVGIVNCWKIFIEHPVLGIGLGGVPPYLYQAWAEADKRFFFPFQNILYSYEVPNPLKLFEPSNVFTELLASLGCVGMAGFLFLIGTFVKKARLSFSSPLTINLILSLLTMLTVLQFNQGLLRTYVWVHFALVYAIIESTARSFRERLS